MFEGIDNDFSILDSITKLEFFEFNMITITNFI